MLDLVDEMSRTESDMRKLFEGNGVTTVHFAARQVTVLPKANEPPSEVCCSRRFGYHKNIHQGLPACGHTTGAVEAVVSLVCVCEPQAFDGELNELTMIDHPFPLSVPWEENLSHWPGWNMRHLQHASSLHEHTLDKLRIETTPRLHCTL